ncbi:MAG TPA: hypothetical protein DEA82_04180 [Flavobacteriaceae bacterium]|nr:hypothetical protein [Flavobacteriaceae bacterium]HBR53409.1 hypothetical protein [Flavobacteriaceae bacterium]
MRKVVGILFILGLFFYFVFTKKGSLVQNAAFSYLVEPSLIKENGMTISERVLPPENFRRKQYPDNSFSAYIQKYPLLAYGAKVVNYDGNDYSYQQGHVGVLDVPVPANGLQQCADALIRLRAEYLWEQGRKDEIGFNFTSGHHCSWRKYAEGYRPKVNGNKVSFHKTAASNHSKENFYKYLNLIYMYAGTQSLYDELTHVETAGQLEVGDMVIKPGFPGHVVMIADKVIDANGKNLFILAQGNTPAQSIHVLKNLEDMRMSPWYELELHTSLEIPTYYFNRIEFVRFK